MKTKIISTLKKELLLVELPENGYYEEYLDGIEVRDFLTDEVLTLANYTILGSPDEIKESDADELVERTGVGHPSYQGEWFVNYKDDESMFESAIKSFNSALEIEIYWNVNPHLDVKGSVLDMTLGQWTDKKNFLEAQEKTFDKKRTLIFVKN